MCEVLEWFGVCQILECFGVCEILEWFGGCDLGGEESWRDNKGRDNHGRVEWEG